jgi:hypothetical protein
MGVEALLAKGSKICFRGIPYSKYISASIDPEPFIREDVNEFYLIDDEERLLMPKAFREALNASVRDTTCTGSDTRIELDTEGKVCCRYMPTILCIAGASENFQIADKRTIRENPYGMVFPKARIIRGNCLASFAVAGTSVDLTYINRTLKAKSGKKRVQPKDKMENAWRIWVDIIINRMNEELDSYMN